MKEIKPDQWKDNVFDAIGRQWMLISAQQEGKVNTMTASWGGMGVLWNRSVATIYVRPQRYTKQFIDASEYFSLCFFDDTWKEQLAYLGRVSGKDEPKIEKAGLTIKNDRQAPYFEQASVVVICRKLYADTLKKESFFQHELYEQNYPNNDLHTMYIGKIVEMITK